MIKCKRFMILLAGCVMSYGTLSNAGILDDVLKKIKDRIEASKKQYPTPAPTPAPTPTPAPSGNKESELFSEINAARTTRGLKSLTLDSSLNCAAVAHSKDIGVKRSCSHTGSDGSSPWLRASRCGTSANGEIVACGQGTPKDAVNAWLNSPGHRAIMLGNYSSVGVGMLNNYWVAIFRS